jgi:SAM-dependent methyltransferase
MGVAEALTIWRLWRRERDDPAPFYDRLAAKTADQLERTYGPVAGLRLLDLGCGPGFYATAFRARGAEVIAVDNDPREVELARQAVPGALLADAGDLPLPDQSVDAVVCSNLLEHTPHPELVIAEIERVLRPGGWAYISWTNWYSPWGGHAMTPYQYLGPRLGPRLYERLHGPPRKNAYGQGLWAVHIGPTLRTIRRRTELDVEAIVPRYWPRLALVCRVPLVREVLTWNCVVRLRRRGATAGKYVPAGIPRRLREARRTEGSVEVVRRAGLWGRGYLRGMLSPPKPGSFTLDGETYVCVHHRHKATWLNERAVELSVAKGGLDAADHGRVLEVGDVLRHYFRCEHPVVDKYEHGTQVIPVDVLDYRPRERYDLVLSVSTLEHVGWDEEPRDPDRALAAIEHLAGLLTPGGRLLVTLPVGYNRVLDRAIADGSTPFTSVRALRRGSGGTWRELPPSEVWDAPYDRLLYTASAILVCEARGRPAFG